MIRVGAVNHQLGKVYNVSDIILHEGFTTELYHHDVALLNISPPIEWSHGGKFGTGAIVPVCITPEKVDYTGSATVAGWGYTKENANRAEVLLNAVDVNIINCADKCDCKTGYPTIFKDEIMLCAGFTDGEKDSCQVCLFCEIKNLISKIISRVTRVVHW